ncbi:pleckstrin homology domain-containing family H member 3 [Leucoraja erinacea]|uniref:pleckstrin homology domain-containing family H member 3 n=1 Tax=Leucoraja erinaceus TaxID=7782 RepID=UPI0024584FD1|nr:pleckstrin homology domain-containing family H member 3 [Leucoraja erinacea]
MSLPAMCCLLCCRRGFRLLGRDDGDADKGEELLEVRAASSEQSVMGVEIAEEQGRPQAPEERRNLISQKMKRERPVVEENVIIQGWLYLELPRHHRWPWRRVCKRWFVLTADSLDYYRNNVLDTRPLGSMVLTSLCSVRTADGSWFTGTGYWKLTVYGRRHHYQLFTDRLSDSMRWTQAIQAAIDCKAPTETPTLVLIRDIQENVSNAELVEQIYNRNGILRHSQKPLYAPLLPFPYDAACHCLKSMRGYTTLQDEALKIFNALQQLETGRDAVALMQGILQTGLDLQPLRDEMFCQLIKQTNSPPHPANAGDLRNWQLLTCMVITFSPSTTILPYLRFHVQRSQLKFPGTETERYAEFIAGSLGKARGRLFVPSSQEIGLLMQRQQMPCVIHYAGSRVKMTVSSHTTAGEVIRSLLVRLDLQKSRNRFALFAESGGEDWLLGEDMVVADMIARFSVSVGESDSQWRLCFRILCILDPDAPQSNIELSLVFEQAHRMVVRGCLPASTDTLLTLATLRLQATAGSFSLQPLPALHQMFPVSTLPAALRPEAQSPEWSRLLPTLWPRGLGSRWPRAQGSGPGHKLQRQREEEAASALASIAERWQRLRGMNRKDAITTYLGIVRQWGSCGASIFQVRATTSCAGCPEPRWLAIGTKGVCLYKQGETESVESFDYQQMSAFEAMDTNTFKITLCKRQLLLESCKVQEIAEVMKIYSANQVRTRTRTRTGGYQIKRTSPVSWLIRPHYTPDKGFNTEQAGP